MRHAPLFVLMILFEFVVTGTAGSQCSPATQSLIDSKHFTSASRDVETAAQRDAPDVTMHCKGRIALARGDADSAVIWLDKAVEVSSANAQHHLWLGVALGEQAQSASSLRQVVLGRRLRAEFQRALELDSTLVTAHRGLIDSYLASPALLGGGEDKAKAQIAVMMRVNPMRAHLEMAAIYQRQDDLAGMEREFVAAVAAGPDSAIAYYTLGGYYQSRKRWAEALGVFDRLIAAKPEETSARFQYARTAVALGTNLDRAEREIKMWIAKDGSAAPTASVSGAHYRLGFIYEHQGQPERAKAEYKLALSLNPENGDAKRALSALKNSNQEMPILTRDGKHSSLHRHVAMDWV